MSPRWATAGFFCVNGAAMGTWVAHISWVQERSGISTSAMSLVIMAMAVGAICAFPIAGQVIVRDGSKRLTWVGSVTTVLAVNLPMITPNPVLVAAGVFVLGASAATQSVSMNSHGVKVEKDLNRPIMSSLHAACAFGGLASAGFAGACAAAGLDARITVATCSVLLLTPLVTFARRLGHGSAAEGNDAPSFALPPRGVAVLAILCLLLIFTEGTMSGWGSLYLRQNLGTSAAIAALGYSFFSAGMTVGRVFGDRVSHRIGAATLLRVGALLTGIPLGAMVLVGQPAMALAAFFLVGVGVANGVPAIFRAAGRQPDVSPGPGIAAVSTMGWLGFLAGPPLIGLVADAVSLPWALTMPIASAVVIFTFAHRANGTDHFRGAAQRAAQPEVQGPRTSRTTKAPNHDRPPLHKAPPHGSYAPPG